MDKKFENQTVMFEYNRKMEEINLELTAIQIKSINKKQERKLARKQLTKLIKQENELSQRRTNLELNLKYLDL